MRVPYGAKAWSKDVRSAGQVEVVVPDASIHLAQAIFVNGLHVRQVECRVSSVLYFIHASKTLTPVRLKKVENVSTINGQYEEITTWTSELLTASDSSATMVIA